MERAGLEPATSGLQSSAWPRGRIRKVRGLPPESRNFVRPRAGITGCNRGLPATACGMYAGWWCCLVTKQRTERPATGSAASLHRGFGMTSEGVPEPSTTEPRRRRGHGRCCSRLVARTTASGARRRVHGVASLRPSRSEGWALLSDVGEGAVGAAPSSLLHESRPTGTVRSLLHSERHPLHHRPQPAQPNRGGAMHPWFFSSATT